jgi:hypothetical protein
MSEQKDLRGPTTALWCAVLCAVLGGFACSNGDEETGVIGPTTGLGFETVTETGTTPRPHVLVDDAVGYSLSYPRTWSPAGALAATEFAAEADCRSVGIVDREPPPDAGPGAEVRSSFVQVCSRPLTDDAGLEEFLRMTYDEELLAGFRRTTVGNAGAFTTGTAVNSITFLQSDTHRLQVLTAVVGEPGEQQERIAQVEEVLGSFALRQ